MTRWVRSGSTQKHKKMPGDATKWGEFDNQYGNKVTKKVKVSEKSQNPEPDSLNQITPLQQKTNDSSKKKSKKMKFENDNSLETPTPNNETSFVTEQLTQFENHSIKKRKKKKKIAKNQCSEEVESGNLISDVKSLETSPSEESIPEKNSMQLNTNSSKKKKKKMPLNSCSPDSESKKSLINHEYSLSSASQNESPEKVLDKTTDSIDKKGRKKQKKINYEKDMVNSSTDNVEKSPVKKHKKRKEKLLESIRKKREAQGILLLPPKVEQKLYRIKKALREKGVPPHVQKEIIRKERRKAELDYRKTFNPSKLCFHCRQPGHLFADCPKKSESMKQETGICFKCGSQEHVSFKCPEKIEGFPLAKCFICKEQGHISRDCPRNKHGVYPKGGRCNICGNVNHLKKDCPSLIRQSEKESEVDVTLSLLNENTSIDAEILPKEEVREKCVKKPKIVKF